MLLAASVLTTSPPWVLTQIWTLLRILNGIVAITATGLTYEADPRHVDLLVESLGLTQANSVATPGAKEPIANYDAQKHHEDDPLPYKVILTRLFNP